VTGTGSPVPAPDSQQPATLPAGTREGSGHWMSYGACHGADPELFFPITTAGRALGQVNSAKALCVRCTVRADCLSYALETRQHGIWGGTTGDERAAMLAISRRVPSPAVHRGNEAMTSQESARAAVTHHPGDISRVRILVADHEPGIRASVGRALHAAGYLPDLAATGPEALRRALGGHYDLIILDLVMPGITGQEVLERLLAARPDQAVVVLSGLAGVAVKVKCLEHGAQDYLTKPFSLAELLARVRLRVRPRGGTADSGRGGTADSGRGGTADSGRAAGTVRAGSLTLDVGRLAADAGDGAVPLTRLEFLLLRELAEHAGQPVPKGRLLASVWGYNFDPGSNVLDVCVRRLRSKLGFELIKTVRGEGYQLADGLMARRIVDRLVEPGCDRRPPAVTGQQTWAGAAREVRRTAARHQIPPARRKLRRAAVYEANHRPAKGPWSARSR
jgi:DNA-binding response OmpR family regulator